MLKQYIKQQQNLLSLEIILNTFLKILLFSIRIFLLVMSFK